jgi:uncharacterized protein YlzI (FlbEa/FlbD family)
MKTNQQLPNITHSNFQRRKLMKKIKSNLELAVIKCKLYRTGNKDLATLNYKRIIDLCNLTFQKPIIFTNGNIFIVLNTIQEYIDFINEFAESIKDTLKGNVPNTMDILNKAIA